MNSINLFSNISDSTENNQATGSSSRTTGRTRFCRHWRFDVLSTNGNRVNHATKVLQSVTIKVRDLYYLLKHELSLPYKCAEIGNHDEEKKKFPIAK